MMGDLNLFALIVVFSVIQSVFGVGLLVFGTPTLLLLGMPFDQTLSILLPCSIAVNCLQVRNDWKHIELKKDFALFSLPLVILGLALVLSWGRSFDIKIYVGILMVLTAVLRTSQAVRERLQRIFRKHVRASVILIGIIHGLTNMGGGLLSAFVSSIQTEKIKIRANIAYCYLLMALCQLSVLFLTERFHYLPQNLLFIFTAGITYLVIGRRVFQSSTEVIYQRILTGFISAFGILLILTGRF